MLLAYSNSWASSSHFFLNTYAYFFLRKKKLKKEKKRKYQVEGVQDSNRRPTALKSKCIKRRWRHYLQLCSTSTHAS